LYNIPSGTKFYITKLETPYTLSYGENPESLSHLGLVWYRDVTPGQTDGRTDGQTVTVAIVRAKHYMLSRV